MFHNAEDKPILSIVSIDVQTSQRAPDVKAQELIRPEIGNRIVHAIRFRQQADTNSAMPSTDP